MEQLKSRILEKIATDYINGKITFEVAIRKKNVLLDTIEMYEELHGDFEDDSSDSDDGG